MFIYGFDAILIILNLHRYSLLRILIYVQVNTVSIEFSPIVLLKSPLFLAVLKFKLLFKQFI